MHFPRGEFIFRKLSGRFHEKNDEKFHLKTRLYGRCLLGGVKKAWYYTAERK